MAQSARERRAAEPTEDDLVSFLWSWITDPRSRVEEFAGRAGRIFLEQGFAPALREDGQVFRAAMRVMNMLDLPQDGLLSPGILARTLPYLARSLAWPSSERAFPGPSKDEALELIERVQKRRDRKRASAKPTRPGKPTPATRLHPDSRVEGHA